MFRFYKKRFDRINIASDKKDYEYPKRKLHALFA